ncbi:hypothetical protein AJ80_02704 [Polytolypa hystricis UAMH7299]|uniref:chitinase n=1 Tax=Polytolypa hystricis (strain UAMH7299) TaxID=1447883 RepID=A0A2B7YQX2_POLH7|nr:hypothetical protein AJ80_02704 [Polytolypa hystricis UAMH7299]
MFSFEVTQLSRPPSQPNREDILSQGTAFDRPYEISMFSNAVYYPNWGIYKDRSPSSLRLGFVSHVIYAFAWVRADGTVYLSDPCADEQIAVDGVQGCLRAFAQLKQQYPSLKLLLAIGGGGQGSEHFPIVARDPVAIERFAESARCLADEFGLDGFDIDWEHPADTQQGEDYVKLLSKMREQFPSPYYILSSALPAGEWALRNINLSHAQLYLDMINLMTYDFSGPWVNRSGHQSQLLTPQQPHNEAAWTSCHSGISYALEQGVPAKKILLGIPVYGRAFPGTNGINQPYSLEGGAKAEFEYKELPRPGTEEQHDFAVWAAYCVDGEAGFVTYDSTTTVRKKARFVSDWKLGGLFYWHIAADALGSRSLVASGYNALHDL